MKTTLTLLSDDYEPDPRSKNWLGHIDDEWSGGTMEQCIVGLISKGTHPRGLPDIEMKILTGQAARDFLALNGDPRRDRNLRTINA